MEDFLKEDWCGLEWEKWICLTDNPNFKLIPDVQGVYRVRPVGYSRLSYIGETSALRTRVRTLYRNMMEKEMPFNDPHTAAANHWSWRNSDNMQFECSVAQTPELTREKQEGLEYYLLWQYRVEKNESTMCNHGRFHPHYLKSKSRASGIRGGRLPDGESNPSGGPSLPPLQYMGVPESNDWMGLKWNEPIKLEREYSRNIPNCAAVYKIMDNSSNEVVYIGETKNLRNRFNQHILKVTDSIKLKMSYCAMPDNLREYNLKEIENDLIGGYYSKFKRVPIYQFSNVDIFQ